MLRRLRRLFRQWREAWADAAYDDVRAELMRLRIVQLKQQHDVERLTAQVQALTARTKV